jgi:hypothetical protein
MRTFLVNNSKAIVILASIVSLAYTLYGVYNRLTLPSGNLKYELLINEVPFLIPALLGFFHFSKDNRHQNFGIALMYFGCLLMVSFFLFFMVYTNGSLGAGVVGVLFAIPFMTFASLFLVTKYFLKSK